MQARWFKHLKDKESKEKFEQRVRNSNDILDVLREVCISNIENSVKKTRTDKFLENPNWMNARAFEDGRQAAFDELLKLLTFKPK